jgi:hypothetical protein
MRSTRRPRTPPRRLAASWRRRDAHPGQRPGPADEPGRQR